MSQLTKPRFVPHKLPGIGVFDTFTQSWITDVPRPKQFIRAVRMATKLNTDYERSITDPDFIWEMP